MEAKFLSSRAHYIFTADDNNIDSVAGLSILVLPSLGNSIEEDAMNRIFVLEHFQDQLTEEINHCGDDLPHINPLNVSPWLAMSLMQKAIRRDRADLALRAAATLLQVSPDRFWRRL